MTDVKTELDKHTDDGLLAVAVNSTALAAEKTVSSYFGMLNDVRTELSKRAIGIIDWTESVQQGTTRLARSFVQRIDDVAGAWIEGNERVSLGAVRMLRHTGHGATGFASRTAASLTSTRSEPMARA